MSSISVYISTDSGGSGSTASNNSGTSFGASSVDSSVGHDSVPSKNGASDATELQSASGSSSVSERSDSKFTSLTSSSNGSVSPLVESANVSLPKSFYQKLTKSEQLNSSIITHGYVHGHIHKHGDHTHIHGHIHNHDHDHHNSVTKQPSTTTVADESCQEFDDLDLCTDIFCDELDDCFFLNCDDSKNSSCQNHGCCDNSGDYLEEICCNDIHCIEDSSSDIPADKNNTDFCCGNSNCPSYSVCHGGTVSSTSTTEAICNDPQCVSDSNTSIVYDCCDTTTPGYPSNHQNNLCDLQLSKKPMFANLINGVHQNLDQIATESDEIQLQAAKKRKLADKNFEIHFPHHCHHSDNPEQSTGPVSDEAPGHHHFHQSCFHTTIQNDSTAVASDSEPANKLMSDFDFYIQFNNFNQFLNNSQPSQNNNRTFQKQEPSIEYLHNFQGAPFESSSESYSCKWDKCFEKLTDDTFLKHLIGQHIGQEYGMPTNNNSNNNSNNTVNPAQTLYQCEWNDCDYINSDLNSLIDHIVTHKGDKIHEIYSQDSLVPLKSQNHLLTPSSSKSGLSSPTLMTSPPILPNSVVEKKEPSSEPRKFDDLNITSIKIMPKKNSSSSIHPEDPNFTCKWQIGVDSDRNPIPCNKIHANAGELQQHLVDEHIGSGKSIYSCDWIGCERHNGKMFTQRQKVWRHIHVHTNFKPCKCEICGATFAVDSMLKQHMRTHSGEKPFSCSICGKKFATSSSLSIHNRVHTGEKPLACKWPGCNKRFSESSNLTKHMKIHFKTFKCEICDEEFEKKPDFTKHMKSHKVEGEDFEDMELKSQLSNS
ncbi:hypothetical protein G9P44_005284 [Scheffersomyces stipitis]|nr:hypothetical protein G9P44_005284 [Scheffersomyces stipitis]